MALGPLVKVMPALVSASRKLASTPASALPGSACAGTAKPTAAATPSSTTRRRIAPSWHVAATVKPAVRARETTAQPLLARCTGHSHPGRRRLIAVAAIAGALQVLRAVGAGRYRSELCRLGGIQTRILFRYM